MALVCSTNRFFTRKWFFSYKFTDRSDLFEWFPWNQLYIVFRWSNWLKNVINSISLGSQFLEYYSIVRDKKDGVLTKIVQRFTNLITIQSKATFWYLQCWTWHEPILEEKKYDKIHRKCILTSSFNWGCNQQVISRQLYLLHFGNQWIALMYPL